MEFRRVYYRPGTRPSLLAPVTVRSAGHYRVANGWGEDREARPFWQLFWVVSGRLQFERTGVVRAVRASEVFAYEAGDKHRITVASEAAEYRWLTIDQQIDSRWLTEQFFSTQNRRPGPPPEDLFEKLYNVIERPDSGAEYECAVVGYAILLQAASGTKPTSVAVDGEDLRRQMERRASDPSFDLAVLAGEVDRDRSTLHRQFVEAQGMSPGRYLARVRLKLGLGLLRTTNLPITEVAEKSGYRDAVYFARVVREATGHSPRALRSLQLRSGQS